MAQELSTADAKSKVENFLQLCARRGRVMILMQNSPDPDALASAMALREIILHSLNKRAVIGYGGTCGRAENRAMMEALRIDAKHITPTQLERCKILCLVDTQPASGNNICPKDRHVQVVIDHHETPPHQRLNASFADIRPEYGANATILYEYCQAIGIKLSSNLATALFYGIQSDTQDLGREASPAGVKAYGELFLLADKKKLARIRRAPVAQQYFQTLADSLNTSVIAGKTVISCVPECDNPETIAEIADLLMRLNGMRCAVCYGRCGEVIHLSARAADARSNMDRLMRKALHRLGSGGGHRIMAGGQVPLGDDPQQTLDTIRERLLKVFGRNAEPIPLTLQGSAATLQA